MPEYTFYIEQKVLLNRLLKHMDICLTDPKRTLSSTFKPNRQTDPRFKG